MGIQAINSTDSFMQRYGGGSVSMEASSSSSSGGQQQQQQQQQSATAFTDKKARPGSVFIPRRPANQVSLRYGLNIREARIPC